jgi:hypothetical protein
LTDQANFFTSVELSLEEDAIFVGAGDNQDGEKGKAFLILLNLFGECEVIGSHVFDEKTEFNLVSIIKRHPTENTLFIGTQRYLVIGQWLQNRFVIFEKYDNSLDFPISDICYHEEALYLTCDNVRGMIIHFDDRIIRNRDPRLNNTRIEKLQYSKLKEKNLVNSKKESAVKSNVQNSLISPEPGRHMKDSNASSSDIGDLKPVLQKTSAKTPIDVEESKISTISVMNMDDSMNPKRIDSDTSEVSLKNSKIEDSQKGQISDSWKLPKQFVQVNRSRGVRRKVSSEISATQRQRNSLSSTSSRRCARSRWATRST